MSRQTRLGASRPVALLVAAGAGLALLASGCGRGGTGRTGASLPSPSTAPGTPSSLPAGSGGDVKPLVDDLARLPTSAFKVTYAVQGTDLFSELTLYWKSPKVRVDATSQGVTARVYLDVTTGTATACAQIGRVWQCQAASTGSTAVYSAVSGLDPTAQAKEIEQALTVPGVTTSTRSIAGQQADCATTPGEQGAPATACLAHSGAVLQADAAVSGVSYAVTATSYSDGVSDADMQPPA